MSTNPKPPDEPTEDDLRTEAIAGGNLWYGFSGSLPAAVDNLSRCHSLDVYERMSHDPDIAAPLMLLKILVLADGVQLQPSVAKAETPGFKRAKEIADFHTRSIAGLRSGITSVFEDMLDAMVFGNKIAEIKMKDGAGIDRGKLVLDSIKPKPYSAVQFVVDRYWNLLGFRPTWGDYSQKVIHPWNCFYLSLHRKNNDPRGNPLSMRASYDAWNFKQNTWKYYDRWLQLNAIRQIIAKVKNGKSNVTVTDKNGNKRTITRTMEVAEAVALLENGTYLVVDADDDVDALETTGTGEQFERAFTIVDKQITKAMLLQELATREGKNQTRAASASMSNYIDIYVWYLKNQLIDAFRSQTLTVSTIVNFGEAALEFLPNMIMGDSERKDWAKDSDALSNIGAWLTDSQWLQGTDQLGFKRPDDGEQLPARVKTAKATSDSAPQEQDRQAA